MLNEYLLIHILISIYNGEAYAAHAPPLLGKKNQDMYVIRVLLITYCKAVDHDSLVRGPRARRSNRAGSYVFMNGLMRKSDRYLIQEAGFGQQIDT